MDKKETSLFTEAAKQQAQNIKKPKDRKEMINEFAETGLMPEELLFEKAQDVIRRYTGLTLTTVELGRLRIITTEVHKLGADHIQRKFIDKENEKKLEYLPLVDEIVARFLWKFYGIDENRAGWDKLFELDNNSNDEREASERVKEWFRRKQEEMHKV